MHVLDFYWILQHVLYSYNMTWKNSLIGSRKSNPHILLGSCFDYKLDISS